MINIPVVVQWSYYFVETNTPIGKGTVVDSLTQSVHISACRCIFMAAFDMSLFMRRLLFLVLLHGDVTGSVIYNERIAGDTCTYIHVCNFEIGHVTSIVACAIKVFHADSGVLVYDTAEATCSVCLPTESDVHELASGQIFHTGGMCPLCDLSMIVILFSIAPLISIT